MLNEKYTFPVHSFVDLITNSSTELYIEATEKTVESIKELVNKILSLGGSKLTCDDLFTVEIDKAGFEENYSQPYDEYVKEEYSERNHDVGLIVKCRDENSELGKETAKVLANLCAMFHLQASANY